jgi:hypothetical protein
MGFYFVRRGNELWPRIGREEATTTSRCAREDCKRYALPGVQIWDLFFSYNSKHGGTFFPGFLWPDLHEEAWRSEAFGRLFNTACHASAECELG